MEKILVVEDSPEIQVLIHKILSTQFQLIQAKSISDALSHLNRQQFALILLDIGLPDGDGFQLCTKIRHSENQADVPIIFLTGRNEGENKMMGFSLGADDYLVKPFDPIELKARVHARLGKWKKLQLHLSELTEGSISINLSTQEVTLLNDEKRDILELTPIEFKLLVYFMKHKQQVLGRDQLLDVIHGQNAQGFDRTIDKHISSLRKKLGNTACYIKTIVGSGYRFSNGS